MEKKKKKWWSGEDLKKFVDNNFPNFHITTRTRTNSHCILISMLTGQDIEKAACNQDMAAIITDPNYKIKSVKTLGFEKETWDPKRYFYTEGEKHRNYAIDHLWHLIECEEAFGPTRNSKKIRKLRDELLATKIGHKIRNPKTK